MTIIEGKDRLIIIDPLLTRPHAKSRLELYYQNRPAETGSSSLYTA